MNEHHEGLGRAIDDLDSLAHALRLPMPAQIHVDSLRESLPELVQRLKTEFAAATGENPWGKQS